MKRSIILFLSVFALTLILSGCGGGGGRDDDDSNLGKATYNLHIQNYDTKADIEGVVINYTDPSGQFHNTTASDKSGNLTITFKKAGSYPINKVTLSDGQAIDVTPLGLKFEISPSEIIDNIEKSFEVTIKYSESGKPTIGFESQASYIFYIQDHKGRALNGAKLNYTDLKNQPYTSVASDANGSLTVKFDQEGVYPIKSITLSDNRVVVAPDNAEFIVSLEEIDNSITKKYLIKINTEKNPPELVAYNPI